MTPRAATFLTFAVNGAVVGTWVAHIPWMQDRLGVTKATIGLCLLCVAVGAMLTMPLAGVILDRFSSASVTRVAALSVCVVLPLPLLATSPLSLAALLFVYGAANGLMDVSMNAHGVAVERDIGRPIMSSLHAGWSIGGFASAGIVAAAGAAGVDPRLETLVMAVLLWFAALVLGGRLGHASAHSGGESFALPTRGVLLIGVLCMLAMLTEGAVSDWSGIYLRHDLGASASAAATGFTGFSLGMAIGRLAGDGLKTRFGAATMLRGGMALVAIVLGAVLATASAVPAVVGFVVVGLGIANAVPILFSAGGQHEPSGPSLAAVFTVGYMGFIAGPPLIGLLSDAVGLPETLALMCVCALSVAVLGGRAVAVPTPARRPAAS